MKKNSVAYNGQCSPANPPPKFRNHRQSEPNFIPDEILNDSPIFQPHLKSPNPNPKRKPRLSELQIPTYPTFLSPPLKSNHSLLSPRPLFLSPPLFQPKTTKRTHSNNFNHSETNFPQNINQKILKNCQLKNKTTTLQTKKDSLQVIEQMLINHGVCLNGKPSNREKVPRLSQPLTQYNQILFFNKIKQKENIPQQRGGQKDLKETMSTSVSLKNIREVGISDFELGRDLGKGKFGRVKIAKHKKSGMIFCLKMIKKSQIKEENIVEQLIKQIKIQTYMNHSHIIKLYSIFDDANYIYLLLELCTEGNLYSLMQRKIKLSEQETSSILREVCEGVNELHESSIVHRDIKPENIVLCFGMAKICDFGWATFVDESMRQTFCGTPLYISPELLSGSLYDEKVDIWAIGILGYEMMTGSIPFRIKSQKDLVKIVENEIMYPKWMSEEGVSFLQGLLEKDPKTRKQMNQMLSHPFLSSCKRK